MTTRPITPSEHVPADVTAFVGQVRAELSDLPPDDVDELTVGLAADLADARADSPDAWREGVGSPQVYAAELRAAAGLPPKAVVEPPRPGTFDGLRAAWHASPARPWLERWYAELRPGGWVLRGLTAGLAIGIATWGQLGALAAVVAVPVSIWIGREARRGMLLAKVLGAVGAVVAAFVLFVVCLAWRPSSSSGYSESYVPTEAYNGGEIIANLYGYDAAGNRVDGLRLYDQSGNPVRATDYNGTEFTAFPGALDPGSQGDVWAGVDGYAWVPPMTIPPVATATTPTPSMSGSSTSSSASSTAEDPTSTGSSSSSSGRTSSWRSGSTGSTTSTPRSTTSP